MAKVKKAKKASKKQIRKEITEKLSTSLAEFIPVVGRKRIQSGVKKLSKNLSRRLRTNALPSKKKGKNESVKKANAAPVPDQNKGLVEAV
ncbi:MAG: hypothetical protein ACHQEM_04400 [Chitinophagales bacterium]